MKDALKYLEIAEIFDEHQQSKVFYKLSEIIGISFFAVGRKNVSIKKKRYILCCNPKKYFGKLSEV